MTPTDVVVVLPGIMGSTLALDGELVWAPSAGSARRAIKHFRNKLNPLQLPEGIGDEHPGDGVEPVGLMPDLHLLPGIWTPVKGYDVLLKRLNALGFGAAPEGSDAPANLLPLAYDWRLSIRYLGGWIKPQVEGALDRWRAQGGRFADAKLIFVCHSMGGLVARWYIEKEGGAEHTRKLITLGTPYRGAAKALVQLVNGVEPKLGPFAISLTEFARSLPSTHQLLPEYSCIETESGLAKTTAVTLPELQRKRVEDAMRFHTELAQAEARRPASLEATHAIVGTQQPTATTVRISGGTAVALPTYGENDLFGDATVPVAGGVPASLEIHSNRYRRIADQHGNLQRNAAALDEVQGVVMAVPVVVKTPAKIEIQLAAPELVLAGEPVPIAVTTTQDARIALKVTLTDEQGRMDARRVPIRKRAGATTFTDLRPGAYTIDVTAVDRGVPVAPVSAVVLVWG